MVLVAGLCNCLGIYLLPGHFFSKLLRELFKKRVFFQFDLIHRFKRRKVVFVVLWCVCFFVNFASGRWALFRSLIYGINVDQVKEGSCLSLKELSIDQHSHRHKQAFRHCSIGVICLFPHFVKEEVSLMSHGLHLGLSEDPTHLILSFLIEVFKFR